MSFAGGREILTARGCFGSRFRGTYGRNTPSAITVYFRLALFGGHYGEGDRDAFPPITTYYRQVHTHPREEQTILEGSKKDVFIPASPLVWKTIAMKRSVTLHFFFQRGRTKIMLWGVGEIT